MFPSMGWTTPTGVTAGSGSEGMPFNELPFFGGVYISIYIIVLICVCAFPSDLRVVEVSESHPPPTVGLVAGASPASEGQGRTPHDPHQLSPQSVHLPLA